MLCSGLLNAYETDTYSHGIGLVEFLHIREFKSNIGNVIV